MPNNQSKELQIININGLVPGKKSIQLQSAPDIDLLWRQLGNYIARSLRDANTISDIEIIQKIFGRKADSVPELQEFEFEGNQRVDELLTVVSIARSTNSLAGSNMIPAWQKQGQGEAMENFSGKKSWDGFIYEHVPIFAYRSGQPISPIPIEVKSLKIHPRKEKFTDLNDLLQKKLPKFEKHFQKEGMIAAVLVFPISTTQSDEPIEFKLIDASAAINKYVHEGAIGCLVFIEILKEKDGSVLIKLKCTFVNKGITAIPNIMPRDIKLFETGLIRFRLP